MAGGVNPSLSLKPLNTRVIKARRWCLISGKQRETNPAFHYLLFYSDFQWKGRCSTWEGTTTKLQTNTLIFRDTQRQCLTSSPRIPDLLGLIPSPEKPDIQAVLLNLRDDKPHQLSLEILTDQGLLHKLVSVFRMGSWLSGSWVKENPAAEILI